MSDRGQGGSRGQRPRDGRGGGRPPAGRRMPPPDATGAEADYLLEHKESRANMVVHLLDGEIIRGVIEYYDRDMFKINRTDGPNVFIRKEHVRYMYEDPTGGGASGRK